LNSKRLGSHGEDGEPAVRPLARLYVSLGVAAAVTVLELVGGILSRSLALMADSGHVATDAAALAVTVIAMRFARKPHTSVFTFGYHRAEVIVAFVNGLALFSISAYLIFQAFSRFGNPTSDQGVVVIGFSTVGLVANLAVVSLLMEPSKTNLNVKGAFLHTMGDALSSIGALAGGVLIVTMGFSSADSLATLFIGALMLRNTYGLVRESTGILMERSPPGVDSDEMKAELSKIVGVKGVHELHVWRLTSGIEVLSVHLVVDENAVDRDIINAGELLLRERFGIRHTTIQVGHLDDSTVTLEKR